MTDEIKALREEIAKLRERVAVLEANRGTYNPMLRLGPNGPAWVNPAPDWTPYVLPTVTCMAEPAADAYRAARRPNDRLPDRKRNR